MRCSSFIILIVSLYTIGQAQISVSPPALFMTSDNRFSTFIVENKTDEPQEVSIKFRFGYPSSDSLGQLGMQYSDSVTESKYSLVGWIKGFPRKFVLPAGAQQIVRLTVQPPSNLADGVYWSRLISSAQPQARRIDTMRAGITTQINMVFEQITTVLYAKGELTTSIDIQDPLVTFDSAHINLIWKMLKSGNAPYFGTATTKVFDHSGTLVDESVETLAIYLPMKKNARFDRAKFKSGQYIAEITFATDRSDIPPDNIVHLPPISKRIAFTLP